MDRSSTGTPDDRDPRPGGTGRVPTGPARDALALLEDTAPGQWVPDVLGPGFSHTTLPQGADEEGPVVSTLVRYRPEDAAPAGHRDGDARPPWWAPLALDVRAGLDRMLATAARRPGTRGSGRAAPGGSRDAAADGPSGRPATDSGSGPTVVLALHGWTDYFYNTGLARFWAARGARFYALDLRRFGRSLRPWQTPGFVTDLAEYDDDLAAALTAIRADVGRVGRFVVCAHSTGGLIASLWADRHPGTVDALVLNSPWLEMQGSWLVRYAAAGIVDPVARLRPRARLKLPETDHYWQSLSGEAHGEWELHPLWRPRLAFPVTAGWISAVLAGHARVARGLDVGCPVLVLTSDRTHLGTQFDAEMLLTDTVIEVDTVRQRALKLGREVSVVAVRHAMHDVFTSSAGPRAEAYAAVGRWADGYLRSASAAPRQTPVAESGRGSSGASTAAP
ncbi:alpha/beta hydrolase [Zafaria sp. Z1313]|uniref:alpha/beta hydrolase n=1 Tax=Zafaria sp. Z1313 TaxID=3423202 RepID=UPI003D301C48